MANFKVQIEGLDILKKGIQQDETLRKIVPDVSIGILKFHNTLERRVGELFTNKNKLTSVLIGRSVSPASLGKTFLRYSLQYQNKPTPLSDYEVTESDSNSISSAPIRIPPGDVKGGVRWRKGKYSKEYKVAVRRGKSKVQKVYGKKTLAFRTRGKNSTVLLLARKRQTWRVRPTRGKFGIRTKLSIVYGPSLANLASSTYDKDAQTQKALVTLQNDIIKAFTRYYGNL